MSYRFWTHWGIAARLLAIAVLPASTMFVAVTGSLYVTAQDDVRRDVAERGRIIATALAHSSQYGLVSGNVSYLRTTLHNLLASNPSIACIAITDSEHRPVVSECLDAQASDPSSFEVPVRIESIPDADLFEPTPGPQAGNSEQPTHNPGPLRTVGQVRVTMSATPIFQAKRQALLAASGVVLLAAVLSCLIGLWLTRRLGHTLASVMAALRAIRRGHFDVKLNTHQEGELGELQRAIVQMAGALDLARQDLEHQVATRTKALQEAVTRVRQADAEKRRLITHSNALIEEDRKRIALELHDHLGASLISVRLEAAALVAKAEASGQDDMAKGARRISATTELLYSSTRLIVKSLRPEVIDTLGLSGAVEEMVRGFDKVHPDCRFACTAATDLPDVRGEHAMPAYRVVQEALTNIVKHSGATQASVALAVSTERDRLHIVIADDGKGFDTAALHHTGLGLIGMRERVAAVGGDLSISSAPDEGTSVCVTLPMPRRP